MTKKKKRGRKKGITDKKKLLSDLGREQIEKLKFKNPFLYKKLIQTR